jgi:hypothetical protein
VSDELQANWDAFEADWYAQEQARVNRIRVRGYALACAKRVTVAKEELERRITLMLRARADAERALAELLRLVEHTEDMIRVVIRNDPVEFDELAQELEELEGAE